jgi:hypothetical protein
LLSARFIGILISTGRIRPTPPKRESRFDLLVAEGNCPICLKIVRENPLPLKISRRVNCGDNPCRLTDFDASMSGHLSEFTAGRFFHGCGADKMFSA